MKPHLVGRSAGLTISMPFPSLKRQTVVLGKANAGKTNLLKGVILALQRTDSPIVVLDAGQTLTADLAATHAAYLERLEDLADDGDTQAALRLERERARTKHLVISAVNTCGVSFNISTLRMIADPATGELRREYVAERVAQLMSPMSHLRGKEAEQFNTVARTARAAFAALVAADMNVVEHLMPFLDPRNRGLHEIVAARINRSEHLNEPIVREACAYFTFIGRNESIWNEHVASTPRVFGYLLDNGDYFDHDSFDFDAFLADGGRLYVTFKHDDPRQDALVRRFLTGLWFSATARRPISDLTLDAFLFNDETKGIDPETLLAHMARSRNYKAFSWLAMQSGAQFGEHWPTLLGIVEQVILFTPSSSADAEEFAPLMTQASIDGSYLPTESRTHPRSEQRGESTSRVVGISKQDSVSIGETDVPLPEDSLRLVATSWRDDDGKERHDEKLVRSADLGEAPLARTSTGQSASRGITKSRGRTASLSRTKSESLTSSLERVGLSEQLKADFLRLMRCPPHHAWFLTPSAPPMRVHVFRHRSDGRDPRRAALARGEMLRQRRHAAPRLRLAYTFTMPEIGKKKGAEPAPPTPPPTQPPKKPRASKRAATAPAWAPKGGGSAA
jgi:hypothetical protein